MIPKVVIVPQTTRIINGKVCFGTDYYLYEDEIKILLYTLGSGISTLATALSFSHIIPVLTGCRQYVTKDALSPSYMPFEV